MADKETCDAEGCRKQAIAIIRMFDTVLCGFHLQNLYDGRLPMKVRNGLITRQKDGKVVLIRRQK
jgi:hypothetical protein